MSIAALRNLYPGRTCHVVGKGPSLPHLAADWFAGPGPVLTLNEAVIPVEWLGIPHPLYSMQKDVGLLRPGRAALLVHEPGPSGDYLPGHAPRYTWDDRRDFGLHWESDTVGACSVISALAFARWFGCASACFVACDACVSGDGRTFRPLPGGCYEVSDALGEGYRGAGRELRALARAWGFPATFRTTEGVSE